MTGNSDLFNNADNPKQSLEQTAAMVEEILVEMGLDPTKDRVDPIQGGFASWLFYTNLCAIYIDLYSENEWNYISVVSPVFGLPQENSSALLQKLLELNHGLYGCSYTINKNSVFVALRRETENLEKTELRYTINRITFYADEAVKNIAQEFNCVPHLPNQPQA